MIVVVKDKNGFYLIGRDARLTLNECVNDEAIDSNDQIFPSQDDPDTIIAVEADPRSAYYIKYLSNLLPGSKNSLSKSYMVNSFVPKLYERLAEMSYVKGGEMPHFDCKLIVIRKTKAFLVCPDGVVSEIGNEEAIGPGSNFSEGILEMNKDKDPLVRLMECFTFASSKSYLVSTDVVVANSKQPNDWIIYDGDDAYKIVDGTFKSSC